MKYYIYVGTCSRDVFSVLAPTAQDALTLVRALNNGEHSVHVATCKNREEARALEALYTCTQKGAYSNA